MRKILILIFVLGVFYRPAVLTAPENNFSNSYQSYSYYDISRELDELLEELARMEEELNIIKEERRFIEEKTNYIMSQNDKVEVHEAEYIVKVIKRETDKYENVDFNVVLAQIKQESNFNKNAVGKDLDTGLTQILPSTGEDIAQKMKIENYTYEMLFDIDMNIKMGVFYLDEKIEMAKRYTDDKDVQLRLGLVAYNAGPRAFWDFRDEGKYRNEYHYHVLRHLEGI